MACSYRFHRMTELSWGEEDCSHLQEHLLHGDGPVDLDLSTVTWFDLWPVVQLCKLIHMFRSRCQADVRIRLPISSGTRSKPLCFLVDIGFVAFALRRGSRICVPRLADLSTGLSDEDASGLNEETRGLLGIYGYEAKEYKDRILLPITEVTTQREVDDLQKRLSRYLEGISRYYDYDTCLIDGCLPDTFFRELAENSIEHSEGALAITTARLIRSTYDIQRSRPGNDLYRLAGKREPLRRFMEQHRDDGYIEMHVADLGSGIQGTLPVPAAALTSRARNCYEYAFEPYTSRHGDEYRLERGKSRLTGLGACAFALQRLHAFCCVRECNQVWDIRAGTGRSGEMLPLEFTSIAEPDSTNFQGCNLQLVLAIEPQSRRGSALSVTLPVSSKPFFYVRAEEVGPSGGLLPLCKQTASLPMGFAGILVDIGDLPVQKDTASGLLRDLAAVQETTATPLVLVRVPESMVVRLFDALALDPPRDCDPAVKSGGWLALSKRLRAYCLSSEADLAPAFAEAFAHGRAPRIDKEASRRLQRRFGLLDLSGQLVFSPQDILLACDAAANAELLRIMKDGARHLLYEGIALRLPGGGLINRYLDLHEMLRETRILALLGDGLERWLRLLQPDLLVTYSACSRALAQSVALDRPDLPSQMDLPDAYTPVSQVLKAGALVGRKVVLLADGVHSGTQMHKVLNGCRAAGADVRGVVAILDTSVKQQWMEDLRAPGIALVRFPAEDLPRGTSPTHSLDPFTLSVLPVEVETAEPALRSRVNGLQVYNLLGRYKALLEGHYRNPNGHHFVLAIDYRRLLGPEISRDFIAQIALEVQQVDAIVVPEDSAVAAVAPQLAAKLNVVSKSIIYAVLCNRQEPVFSVGSRDARTLERIGAKGGSVVFIDDAVRHGSVLRAMIKLLASHRILRVEVFSLVDNRPPGAALARAFTLDGRDDITIAKHGLHRVFLPVWRTSTECPWCRISTSLEAAATECPQPVLISDLRGRIRQISPVDYRELRLAPWQLGQRGETISGMTDATLGIPEHVEQREVVYLAFLEMTNTDCGLRTLVEIFDTPLGDEYAVFLARILADCWAGLCRLGLDSDYPMVFLGALKRAKPSTVGGLLETVLIWPIEAILQYLPKLLEAMSRDTWTEDGAISSLYAVIAHALRYSTEESRHYIGDCIQSIVKATRPVERKEPQVTALAAMVSRRIDPSSEVPWAIGIMARRLLFHRKEHHRLTESLGRLASTSSDLASTDVALRILNLTPADESIDNLAAMISLGELEDAVQILLRNRELKSTPAIDELHDAIMMFFEHRATVRRLLGASGRLVSVDTRDHWVYFSAALSRICRCLDPKSPTTAGYELAEFLRPRIVSFKSDIVYELQTALKNAHITSDLDRHFENSLGDEQVLANPPAVSYTKEGIVQNIKDYCDSLLPVLISGTVGPTYCQLSVRNSCRADQDISDKLRRHSIQASRELARYGGNYSSEYCDKAVITTIQLLLV